MPARRAQTDGAPPLEEIVGTRAADFAALKKEHEDAMDAYYALFRDAKTEAEAEEVGKTAKAPDQGAFIARAQALLDVDPKDDLAFEILTWMLENVRDTGALDALFATIESYHTNRESIGGLCPQLISGYGPRGRALVERLAASSPHESVRASALYALAKRELEDVDHSKRLSAKSDEEGLADLKHWLGEAEVARLAALDIVASEAKAMGMLERIATEFAAVPYRKSTYGDRAKADLFEIRSLAVGKIAPEIAGEDIAGTPFKLGDYRGKVVLLDFWGNW